MFARLNAGVASKLSASTTSATSGGPKANEFSFEDRSNGKKVSAEVPKSSIAASEPKKTVSITAPAAQKKDTASPKDIARPKEVKKIHHSQDMSPENIEKLYILKAVTFVLALPTSKNNLMQIIQSVTKKMRNTYAPTGKLSAEETEILKKRFVFAIVNYINHVVKKSAGPVKANDVKKMLEDSDGNILAVYGALVEQGYLALDNIEGVTSLFKMCQDVLPKAEPVAALATPLSRPTVAALASTPDFKPAAQDPTEKLTAWPAQEKRESRKLSNSRLKIIS